MLKIENWPIEKFIPYARNPRKNDAVVERMVSAIKEFGFRIPIVAKSDGTVVDGHLRLKAAQSLGMTELPVALADELTDAQVKAFRLLANRSVSWADWDSELLKLEFEELQSLDFDIELTGFDSEEIQNLLSADDILKTPRDDGFIPDADEPSIVQLGDIWQMGKHKLSCGDSTSQNVISTIMDGYSIDTVVYDPPYDNDELWNSIYKAERRIVFCDYKRVREAVACLSDMPIVYEFIWDGVTSWYTPNRPLARHKTAFVGLSDARWDFDRAIYHDGKKRESKTVHNSRGYSDYNPLEDGNVHLSTVFQKPNTQVDGEHEHGKPVEWVSALLLGCGAKQVLDMFGGGGSVVICCEQLKIPCFTVEIQPKNCDAIIARWEKLTGCSATLLRRDPS